MHLEMAVVFDEPELAELVHKIVDVGARGANARSHQLLADRHGDRAQLRFLMRLQIRRPAFSKKISFMLCLIQPLLTAN